MAMYKRSLAQLVFFLFSMFTGHALAAPGDHDVIPGERIGKIRIGMRSADVHAQLGKPGGAADRKDGLREEVWSGGRNEVQQVRVLLDHGLTVQVSATSSAFRTPDGLSTSAKPAAILRLGLRRTGFELRGSGGGFAYYYDDIERGIAWQITGTGIPQDGEPPFRIYAVIVHAPKRPVAVDDDLVPCDPGEECAPETPAKCE